MTIKEAYKIAEEFNKKILATDERLKQSVALYFDEGSFQFINNAFAAKQEEYWMIFTEHHGFSVYHEDDIMVATYKRIN